MREAPTWLGWRPTRRRQVRRPQVSNTPAMLCDPGGPRRCRRPPDAAQTRGRGTTVIDHAAQIPPVRERPRALRQRPSSMGQRWRAPLLGSRPGRGPPQAFEAAPAPLAAGRIRRPPAQIPRMAATPAAWLWSAEGAAEHLAVSIRADQHFVEVLRGRFGAAHLPLRKL